MNKKIFIQGEELLIGAEYKITLCSGLIYQGTINEVSEVTKEILLDYFLIKFEEIKKIKKVNSDKLKTGFIRIPCCLLIIINILFLFINTGLINKIVNLLTLFFLSASLYLQNYILRRSK